MKHAAAIAGFTAAFYPLLIWYATRMRDGSDDPLGLVALAVAAAIGWSHRGCLKSPEKSRVAALCCLAVYGAAVWFHFPPLLRSIPALACVILWFGIWRLPPVVVLAVLSLPLLASLQFYAGYPLRLFAAEAARGILSILQFEVTRSGVDLVTGGRTVGVDAPCSGVKMLWTGVFLAAAVAGKFRLGWCGTLKLCIIACLVTVLANVLRVCLLFFPEAGLLSLPHWTHEATGLVCFAAGAAALIFTARRIRPGLSL